MTLHHILPGPDTYTKQYVRHTFRTSPGALDNKPMLPQKPFVQCPAYLGRLKSHSPQLPVMNQTKPNHKTPLFLLKLQAHTSMSFWEKMSTWKEKDLSYKVVSRVKCSKRPNRSRSEAKSKCVREVGEGKSSADHRGMYRSQKSPFSFREMACPLLMAAQHLCRGGLQSPVSSCCLRQG